MVRKLLTCILGGMLAASQSLNVLADDQPGALYEDDAWWDVTEWFDGNDFNPTDEQWFRWDNETYEAASAYNSTDTDNDSITYGFEKSSASSDDDWYYDYDFGDHYSYNDYDSDGMFEFAWRYYDYDNDGYFDAYASYSDLNEDGIYDDFTFLTFESTDLEALREGEARKDASGSVSKRSSKMFVVKGAVDSTKTVKARDGEHLVASVQMGDRRAIVDLGKAEALDINVEKGKYITARGPMTAVGEKVILLAHDLEYEGKSLEINRSPRSLSGQVTEVRTAKLRKGQSTEHTLVRLKTDDDKQALVDLGPTERLSSTPESGQAIDVAGVAVKIKERPVMMADSITLDGKKLTIKRGKVESGKKNAAN